MKKILISIFFLSLFGCRDKDLSKYKYRAGDIVYLKPDSTKAVIKDVNGAQDDYTIVIGYKSGFFANNMEYINEDQIYGKVK